ncbi:hypothetical protein MUP37_00285 [Candidatus Bathyarchaeota archaeon]|nr:hypothetical protein [Candidatus Bathyarchaeota archaeon]
MWQRNDLLSRHTKNELNPAKIRKENSARYHTRSVIDRERMIMNIIEEMRYWKGKPKELVTFLTNNVKEDRTLFTQLVDCLKNGSDVEKGTSADIMKNVTKDEPEIALPYIDEMIEYINYEAPRVKWGIPESIGNIAKAFPDKVETAIPKLLKNTKNEGTVVRWCAAYALSEIIKSNEKIRGKLVPEIEEIVKNEENNGVRNVYIKALRTIGVKV